MAAYSPRNSPQTRHESSLEIHTGEPRFSTEQKGKHRETYLSTCLDRAPMSSARSTLFLEDPPATGATKEGRLETEAAENRRMPLSPSRHADRSAHPKVHSEMGYDRHAAGSHPMYGPARRSLSHPSALDDEAMSNRLRLKTPAFGNGNVGRPPTPLHWSVPVYEQQLAPRGLGFPLAIPTGLRIGDVCFLAANGKVQKCFNITQPTELPHYFSVLHPPLTALDICTYQDFPGKSYIASRSLQPVRDDPTFAGLAFSCNANTEAAVLIFPQGASSTELTDLSKFREYISANARNWARFARELQDESGAPVELRLVTSALTAPFWANAVVCAEGSSSVLKFAETKTVDGRNAYVWDTRGFAKAAVSASDAWNPASRNDCTIVKGFTITPRRKEPAAETPVVRASGYVPTFRHPCDIINRRLLSMDANVSVVASHDRDWCAILRDTDDAWVDESELLRRVFSSHDLQEDGDAVFLRWKHHKEKKTSAEDLKKQIDDLRESLEKVEKDDVSSRTKLLHTITSNILTYIRIAGSKNLQQAELLLSVAMVNAKDEVAALTAQDDLTASSMHLLASTFWVAFEMAGDPKLLDQAISSYRKALTIDATHGDSMSDLATALWARFNRYKQQKDLDELVEMYKALLFTRPVNNPDEVKWLNSIGMGMWEKYRRSNDPTDMDQAVAYLRRASRSYPVPCDPFTLSNLGNALLARSRHRRDLHDLNEALLHYRKALVAVSPLHPGRSAFLSNLGDALLDRYERTSDLGDLNEAIRAYEQTLELPAPHHRDKVTCIMLYANALQDRFKKTFDTDDLTLAVKKYREAKHRSSPAHHNYGRLMENLLMAEQEQRRLNALSNTATPPPPSTISSPASPHARIPTSRSWSQQQPHHVPSQQPAAGQKFRIVRPPTKKPYSKKTTWERTSDSDESPPPEDITNPPLSPVHHMLPPRARRHQVSHIAPRTTHQTNHIPTMTD